MVGFEDLKAKDVLAFGPDGTVLVLVQGNVKRLQMQVTPSGSFTTRPVEVEGAPDQVAPTRTRSAAERFAMTDQGTM
jgi:hypothetical protein